jgi:redox-sensitive bicupin YhaK (pirin superfamily)
LKAGAKTDFSFPANYNTALLVIEGAIKINGRKMCLQIILLSLKMMVKILYGSRNRCCCFDIKVEPIKEPIAAHGHL